MVPTATSGAFSSRPVAPSPCGTSRATVARNRRRAARNLRSAVHDASRPPLQVAENWLNDVNNNIYIYIYHIDIDSQL